MQPRRKESVAELLAGAESRLKACGVEGARLDSEVLLAQALGVDRGRLAAMLAAGQGALVEEEAAAAFRGLIRRRALREPIAYITGRREFWSLDLEVTPAVLIPRPETELLVEEALAALARVAPPGRVEPRVAEIGTGSGAVAVAMALERPDAFIAATDLSGEALAVARRNTKRHGVDSRVALARADLLEGLAGPFHVVVSNPPYVGEEERAKLMPEVRAHEPPGALFAGPGGLDAIARLIVTAAERLVPGGWLLIEIGATHASGTLERIRRAGIWQDVGLRDDYAGVARVARARRGETDRT